MTLANPKLRFLFVAFALVLAIGLFSVPSSASAAIIISQQTDGSISASNSTMCDNLCSNITVGSQVFVPTVSFDLGSIEIFTSDFSTRSSSPDSNTCYIALYNQDTNTFLALSDNVFNGFGCAGNLFFTFNNSHPLLETGTRYRWDYIFGLQNFSSITFTGSPNNTAGGAFSVSPLENAKFTAFGTIAKPTSLSQFQSDGITPILEGGITSSSTVVLGASLPSSFPDSLQLQLEMKPSYIPFDDQPNILSPFVSSGSFVSVPAINLLNSAYHWQARVVDAQGNRSLWQTISNPATEADFIVHDASSIILQDVDTRYTRSTQPNPCFGDGSIFSCALSPEFHKYIASLAFPISKITFDWRNSGGNNCDDLGHYGAIVTSANTADSIVATSSNTVYLGCAGFGGGNQGVTELNFKGEVIPPSFYLTFGAFDGALQGGSQILVSNVKIYIAANPYIQNVLFGQDDQGDYISFDWVGIPPPDDQVAGWLKPSSYDRILIWLNRSNPYGTTTGMTLPSEQYPDSVIGDFTPKVANGGTADTYTGFGHGFASGNPYGYSSYYGQPALSQVLPQHFKTYINPGFSPWRTSFSDKDFLTFQIVQSIPTMIGGYTKLVTSDDSQYFYQTPVNPLPTIPYTNVKFGFDENNLLKVSFDWVGLSRWVNLAVGLNGAVSYTPWGAGFTSDAAKDVSMTWERGVNLNLGYVDSLTDAFLEQGKHYDLPVIEMEKWTPNWGLQVSFDCGSWWWICSNPIRKDALESFLGRSFNLDDYITIAFRSQSPSIPYPVAYDFNDPSKYYFAATTPPNQPPTLTFRESSPDGLSENDGIEDNKGTADKTLFGFDVIYTDQDNDVPTSVKLVVEKVNQGAFENYPVPEMLPLPFLPQEDYTSGQMYVVVSDDLIKGMTFPKGNYRYRFEASDGVSSVQTPFTEFTVGYSNIAFLPGLEASRLYKPGLLENQLWEPNKNDDVEKLYLSPTTGESLDPSIYTRDVIDEANIIPDPTGILDTNIYKSFISLMNTMKSDSVIKDWESLPYDWRLDFDDILASGKKNGNNISYLETTSTPFILQELHRLAETSDTGKVTIITHSNGGLLAKYLLKKLEDENDPFLTKVDKLIMVTAPQVGTPSAVEGLLHGDEQQLGVGDFGFLLDEERVRELAENMQSAYNLLPSEKYFENVQSPVIIFDTNTLIPSPLMNNFVHLYGDTINSPSELHNFLLGDPQSSTPRIEPAANDEESPNVLKQNFLSNAETTHNTILDTWVPPARIEVIQIAGWGIKTLRGIKYFCGVFCESLSTLDRDILQTDVGDGTVVVPSAVAMTTDSNTERYYVNIREQNFLLKKNRNHSSILEVDSLLSFIKNLIQEDKTLTNHISTTIPPIGNLTALDYIIHSPVDIHLYDAERNHTGLVPNPLSDSDLRAYEAHIPNSYYREYGEAKYAGSDTFATTTVQLVGKALGTFTFDINETLGDEIIASTTWKDIPVTASSTLTMSIQTITNSTPLQMDVDGDGTIDTAITPGEGVTPQELIAILKGIVKTFDIPDKKEEKLLKKIDKLEKVLEKEFKNDNKKKQKTKGAFIDLIQKIKNFEKKGLLTHEEVMELLEIIGRIQASIIR